MKLLTLLIGLCFFSVYSDANDKQPKYSGAIYGGVNSNYTYGNNYVTTLAKKGELDVNDNVFYMQGFDDSRMPHGNFGFGLFAGYVHRINKILLMWDISYDSNKSEQRANNKYITVYAPEANGDLVILDPILEPNYVKFKRNDTWAGSFRLGYLIESSIIAFIKGSLLYSTFYLEHGSMGFSKNTQKKITGFEPGIGVDINFPNGLFIRGEYGYQMFKKFTSSNLILVKTHPNEAITCSVSPRYHVIRLGLGYKLNIF